MKSLTCVRAGSQGFPSVEYETHNQLHGNLVWYQPSTELMFTIPIDSQLLYELIDHLGYQKPNLDPLIRSTCSTRKHFSFDKDKRLGRYVLNGNQYMTSIPIKLSKSIHPYCRQKSIVEKICQQAGWKLWPYNQCAQASSSMYFEPVSTDP